MRRIKHQRMEVTVQTSDGPVTGTITGDPNMPRETADALQRMMQCLYEMAKKEVMKKPSK